jgi:tRNA dimethylallyltransferase
LEKIRPVVGLAVSPPLLAQHIQARVSAMFEQGLLDEARQLREKFPRLSDTAQQAIGYAEAFAVLDGRCTAAEAQERIGARTRQLAKRQMTWFKHQAHVAWVTAEAPAAEVAARVRQLWSEHGPTPLAY